MSGETIQGGQAPTTRRGAGEGSIDELPSGKFRVRVRLPNGKRRSRAFGDLESAQAFRRGALAIFADEATQEAQGPREQTFDAYGLRWLDRRELAGEHRSIESQRSVWRRHVSGSDLGDAQVALITRRDVHRWLEGMKVKRAGQTRRTGTQEGMVVDTGRPLARGTIHTALVLVRQALQAAMEEEVLSTNPARDVQIGRGRVSAEPKWTYLDEKEIHALLGTEREGIEERDRLIYTVAIYTGLREGELWGLKWRCVHLTGERPHLDVRFSYKGPTKSGRPRMVPLLAPALEALKRWKAIAPANRLDLVFPNREGEMRAEHNDNGWADRPVGQGKQRRVIPGHKTLAGITRAVRFHDLRHTCASALVMGAWGRVWKIEEVRDFLGHTNISTTLRYAHLSPDHLHRAARETVQVTNGSPAPEGGENSDEGSGFLIRRSGVRVPSRVPLKSQGFSPEEVFGRDPSVTQLARDVLGAVAATGEVPSTLIEEFLRVLLDVPFLQSVLRAQEPGPMRLPLVLRLAAEILGAARSLEELRGAR